MRNRSHNVMVRMDDEEYNQFCINVKESDRVHYESGLFHEGKIK